MLEIVTASIVLYKNDKEIIKKAVNSLFNSSSIKVLFLIDNSPKNCLKSIIIADDRIVYVHNPSNPGFGEAHNLAIQKAIELGSKYHFVVNPDIYFKDDVTSQMVDYMKKDSSIGMMMPQILNFNDSVQNLPKLLPSPYSVIMRKLKRPAIIYNKFINKYELRMISQDIIYNVPILSGCFTLLNLEAIKKVGMYDNRFFMYFEDWDLSRRMHQSYKTIYYPLVSVYHGYASDANKSAKIFMIFIKSAIRYFNKWGWFFDKDRDRINKNIFRQF